MIMITFIIRTIMIIVVIVVVVLSLSAIPAALSEGSQFAFSEFCSFALVSFVSTPAARN